MAAHATVAAVAAGIPAVDALGVRPMDGKWHLQY